MPFPTVGEILELVEGTTSGPVDKEIQGVGSLSEAGPLELSFLANPHYAPLLETTRAASILVGRDLEGDSTRWIRVRDPYVALAFVLQRWFSEIPRPEGVSKLASIASSAQLGRDVRIGAFVTIGDRAVVGDRVTIFEGAYIGPGSVIGDDSSIHPNVVIHHDSQIGRRCIVHASSVIGADGYGFATDGGRHHKIPQIGIVRIEDDVEIGASTTIDRAALGETVIGEGTKIDNLVQIAHNVKIGKHCLIVAQVGIAGSTEIGDDCVFGGQAGAGGHLKIGPRVMVGAKGTVMKDWEGPAKLAGFPARLLREHLRTEALVRRLPEIVERLERLETNAKTAGQPRDQKSKHSE